MKVKSVVVIPHIINTCIIVYKLYAVKPRLLNNSVLDQIGF